MPGRPWGLNSDIYDNAPGENSTKQNIKNINEGETKAAEPLLK